MKDKTTYYSGIDGLRTIAAIGVIIMHIAKNANYSLSGFIYENIVCRMESFVNLFFVISGFSMCVGYYTKIKNNKIDLNEFYKKRYYKILPFFTVLVFLDLLLGWEGISSLYEAFADLTLLFAFLPGSSISVIGVGWTLGVIFAFYCLFPFFVFLLWSKRRAWFMLIIMIIMQYLCEFYFLVNGKRALTNILMWSVYFILGGIIYLYKDEISKIGKRHKSILLTGAILSGVIWIFTTEFIGHFYIFTLKTLLICGIWISYAISTESKVLSNKFTKFISSISLEIYLAHMVIYRAFEKFNLLTIFPNNEILSYISLCILVIGATTIFAFVLQKALKVFMQAFSQYRI